MPNISVVVVCYNAEENVEQCLSSLLNQTYPKDLYEIIFVDNGSTDRTQEIITEYASRFSNLRMVINPTLGIATSRNMSLREAKYDYIASTDSDCIAPEKWLENLRTPLSTLKKERPWGWWVRADAEKQPLPAVCCA